MQMWQTTQACATAGLLPDHTHQAAQLEAKCNSQYIPVSSMDKAHLVMVYDLFNVLLDSDC